MIVPSKRLLWAAAAVALPLAALAGMYPPFTVPCAIALAGCAAAAAFDAAGAARRAGGVQLWTPQVIRMTKGVAGVVPVTVQHQGTAAAALRLGVNPPPGTESESPVLEISAAPGTSVVDWPCEGHTRGAHMLREVYLETGSPLGLWMVRQARPVETALRVYPNLRDRATAALFLRTANSAVRMQRQVGKGREFENLRHYLPGDSFDDIHWKATAKRNFPAVKLYRVEHAQEVYAIVDASRLSAREEILESFVDAALHLALVAEKQGDRFGLVTFSDRTHRFVRARSGMDHFRLCRETIYNLHAERVSPDFREVFTTLQLNLRRRCLLVFFTSLDDALLGENFERDISLLARRHVVLVNVRRTAGLRPIDRGPVVQDLEGLYTGLAGQMLWNRMRTLQVALGNRGVRLTITDPDQIKMQVTAGYLDIKRRQIL